MPTYILQCTDEECGEIAEKTCKYSDAKEYKCEVCGKDTKFLPTTAGIRIFGYSEENGYSKDSINYDGSNREMF